jgi:hypothetical protein
MLFDEEPYVTAHHAFRYHPHVAVLGVLSTTGLLNGLSEELLPLIHFGLVFTLKD